jgi:hypothetical protein
MRIRLFAVFFFYLGLSGLLASCITVDEDSIVSQAPEETDPLYRGYGELDSDEYITLIGEEIWHCKTIQRALNNAASENAYLYDHDIFLRWNPVDFQAGRDGYGDQAWSNNPDRQSKYPKSLPRIRYDWLALPIYNNNENKTLFRLRTDRYLVTYKNEHGVKRDRLTTHLAIEENFMPFARIGSQYILEYQPMTRRYWYSCLFLPPRYEVGRRQCMETLRDTCSNCDDNNFERFGRFVSGYDIEFEIIKISRQFMVFFRRKSSNEPLPFNGRQYRELINVLTFSEDQHFDEKCLLGVPAGL